MSRTASGYILPCQIENALSLVYVAFNLHDTQIAAILSSADKRAALQDGKLRARRVESIKKPVVAFDGHLDNHFHV
jgi:hypothetical protein